MAIQTPQQRRANEKYAKKEAQKRGQPEDAIKVARKPQKPTISPFWIGVLAFILLGGAAFELVRFFM